MRILHIAPFNYAGLPMVLSNAEKELGHYSRLITFTKHRFDYPEDICLNLPFIDSIIIRFIKKIVKNKKTPVNSHGDIKNSKIYRKYNYIETKLIKLRELFWQRKIRNILEKINIDSFDLIQLDGGTGFFLDSRIIKSFANSSKKIISVFYGSDLRVRGIDPVIEKYTFKNFSMEYDHQEILDDVVILPFPFIFDDFDYKHKDNNDKLTIGHAPSVRKQKGTNIIIPILNKLKEKHKINIKIIEGLSHQSALKEKEECDIFIDQISELGYGVNSVESMAMGIPTFSSLRKEFNKKYPANPFVEINKETLFEKLEEYILSREKREFTGSACIKWVREVHDTRNVVKIIHSYTI